MFLEYGNGGRPAEEQMASLEPARRSATVRYLLPFLSNIISAVIKVPVRVVEGLVRVWGLVVEVVPLLHE